MSKTFTNAAGSTAQAEDQVQADYLLAHGYIQQGAVSGVIQSAEMAAPPVPHLGTLVVFRHPGAAYSKGQDYYVPAIVLGSNADASLNIWAFSIHSLAPELGVAYGPEIGQYQSQAEAVDAMAKRAEAKAKADAMAAKVAKDLADKRAAEEAAAVPAE